MGILHDRAAFDLTVLFKEASDLSFRKPRMDAGHEEVGPRIASGCFTIIVVAVAGRWAADQMLAMSSVSNNCFKQTENPCGRSVRHSYHDHHGSCLRALADSHRHAWGEEKHFGRARARARKLALLRANVSSENTLKYRSIARGRWRSTYGRSDRSRSRNPWWPLCWKLSLGVMSWKGRCSDGKWLKDGSLRARSRRKRNRKVDFVGGKDREDAWCREK